MGAGGSTAAVLDGAGLWAVRLWAGDVARGGLSVWGESLNREFRGFDAVAMTRRGLGEG